MTVPNAVALLIARYNFEALFVVLLGTNGACVLLVGAVSAHLRANFTPAKGSIRDRILAFSL